MVSSCRDQMDDNDSDGVDISVGSEQSRKRSMTYVRGSNLLKKVRKASFEGKRKIPLKFNARGVPIGEHKSLFQHYVGYLARSQVSIGYTCWNSVPKQIQNAVYETLMSTFDIPAHAMDKKAILTNVASKWSHFRTNLGNLTKAKNTGVYPENPPEDYPYIDKDSWSKFVQHRSTKSFQAVLFSGILKLIVVEDILRLSGRDNLSLSSRRGVWEVLCSQDRPGIRDGHFTTLLGYTGGVPIPLQLDTTPRDAL